MTKTVFLGGTCNGSLWRDRLIKLLKINYYNPVVPDWTPACMQAEIEARATSDFVLYVITPKMTGVYSIAEAVEDSNKAPGKTVFTVLESDGTETFTTHQMKSFQQTAKLIAGNGAQIFYDLETTAGYLNGH
jgi:hypothetical protein